MKRILVFGGDNYYPLGGMSDFSADFDTIEEAEKFVKERREDWSQIYDQEKKCMIQ